MDIEKILSDIAPENVESARVLLEEAEGVRKRLRTGRYRVNETTATLSQALSALMGRVAAMQRRAPAAEDREYERLREICAGMPDKQARLAEKFMRQAARLRGMLDELMNDIAVNGMTEPFRQSEKVEPFDRERPSVAIFAKLDKNYHAALSALCQLLPPEGVQVQEVLEEEDDLAAWRAEMLAR